ncbi:MAG: hypothetical protein D6707_09445 [Bacteroidetes bacterium]|nr:MAG: hypothetical protein D6707_09445 [Bacteroidota bacterium]
MNKNLVDVHTLAEFWGVDARTVQNYADARYENPPLPREERGKYNFVKAMKWMYNRQKRKIEILENSGDEKLHALKVNTQKVILEERKLKLRRLLGELVDADAVRIAWLTEVKYFEKAIDALVPKLDHALENVTDPNQRREILRKFINEAKLSIAQDLKIDQDEETEEEILKEIEQEQKEE